jgi:hypothetical protein
MPSVKPILADYLPLPDIWGEGPVSGRYNIRAKYEVIRDYHWTAALSYMLLVEPR